MTFELIDTFTQTAVIKVIGVGGGGGNALEHMVENQIEFYLCQYRCTGIT